MKTLTHEKGFEECNSGLIDLLILRVTTTMKGYCTALFQFQNTMGWGYMLIGVCSEEGVVSELPVLLMVMLVFNH